MCAVVCAILTEDAGRTSGGCLTGFYDAASMADIQCTGHHHRESAVKILP